MKKTKLFTSKILSMVAVGLLAISILPFSTQEVYAGSGEVEDTSLFGEVLVSDAETSPIIQNSNTSRNLAVSTDGIIYATYHCDEGVKVTKSTDRGETFQASVLAYGENVEAEIAVSTTGIVYLAWVESDEIKLIKSTDMGMTFSEVIILGETENNSITGLASTVHITTDGKNIYVIDSLGKGLYRSTDCGDNFTFVELSKEIYAFSDVFVDPTTHQVIVQEDNPSIKYYISDDFGATFGEAVESDKMISYSVGSFGADSEGRYLIVAGSNDYGVKINLDTNRITLPDFGTNDVMQGRSLSSDMYGNIVTGYIEDNDENLLFLKVSNDMGVTFNEPILVGISTDNQLDIDNKTEIDTPIIGWDSIGTNASINTTNGDVLFLYEKDGNIYLKVYGELFVGYDLGISNSSLYFNADEDIVQKDVTITNTRSTPLPINSIEVTEGFSIDKSDLDKTIQAGESAVIQVKFDNAVLGTSTGSLIINYGDSSEEKIINLSGYTSNIKTIKVTETPAGITNTQLISVVPVGEAFDESVEVRMKDNSSVEEEIEVALYDALKEKMKDLTVFSFDISLYVKGTETKIQPNDGTSVIITCPIPDNMLADKDKLRVACITDGELDILDSELVVIDGVDCVQFTATHFSPYALVMDTTNALDNIGQIDAEYSDPDTGDNNIVGVLFLIAILSFSTILINKKNMCLKL